MGKSKKYNKTKTTKKIHSEFEESAIRDFYKKILLIQENERRRISRDLHDETGQMVIALGAALNIIERELKKENIKKAMKVINENRELIQNIAKKMKTMAFNLRPPALDILGLSAVLREFFSQCTKSNPIKIEFKESIKDINLNENLEITLYRIIQEAVTNILKHAKASSVRVDLTHDKSQVSLLIKDDGRGFNIDEYNDQADIRKMGLRGIKERVVIIGGEFSIESSLNKGTTLKISFSLDKASKQDSVDFDLGTGI